MLTVRPADARGVTRIGWLDSRHTFSFGDYFDPAHHRFRALRVINDDRVTAGGGFPTHPHRDMEILTYVLAGAVEHRDSLGNGSVIPAGGWQYMSAGAGVRHSEFNPSRTDPAHFLQIWIVPETKGLPPAYAEWTAPAGDGGGWRTVASRDGRDGSMRVRADATLSVARLAPGERVGYEFTVGRGGWLHVARGGVSVNGLSLTSGDGLAVEEEPRLEVSGGSDGGEVLLFDLA